MAFAFAPSDPAKAVAMHWRLYDEIPAFDKEMEAANVKTVYITPQLRFYTISTKPIRTAADSKA
jgi:hypothetical protein